MNENETLTSVVVEIYTAVKCYSELFLTTLKSNKNRSASEIRISDEHKRLIHSLHKAVQL